MSWIDGRASIRSVPMDGVVCLWPPGLTRFIPSPHPTPTRQPWVLSALYTGNVFIWDYSSGVRDTLYGGSIGSIVSGFLHLHPYDTTTPHVPDWTGDGQVLRGVRPAGALRQVRGAQVLVHRRLRRHVPPGTSWVDGWWSVELASHDLADPISLYLRTQVYNYNTMEKVKAWEAHMDYIRYVEVHPSLPYVIRCVREWKERGGARTIIGWSGSSILFSTNSASDDMTIKLWDWDKGWDCTQVGAYAIVNLYYVSEPAGCLNPNQTRI